MTNQPEPYDFGGIDTPQGISEGSRFPNFSEREAWDGLRFLAYEPNARSFLAEAYDKGKMKWTDPDYNFDKGRQEKFIKENATLYLLNSIKQAQEYYAAGESSGVLTKPLLLYYGMVSLVKALIISKMPDFYLSKVMHGMTRNDANKRYVFHSDGLWVREKDNAGKWHNIREYKFDGEEIQIRQNGLVNLLRKSLDKQEIANGTTFTVSQFLSRIPESLCHYDTIYGQNPYNLIDVEAEIKQGPGPQKEPNKRHDFFVEIRVDKGKIKSLQNIVLHHDDFGSYELGDQLVIHSKRKITNKNYAEAREELMPLLMKNVLISMESSKQYLMKKCVASDTTLADFTEVEIHFILMFLLGFLARYQPHIWREILNGKRYSDVYLLEKFINISAEKFPVLVRGLLFEK